MNKTNIEWCDYTFNPVRDISTTGVSMIDLLYCIRLKHSEDMPLKRPRKNCAFKNSDECTWHPATLKYIQENNIPWTFSTRFRCVIK